MLIDLLRALLPLDQSLREEIPAWPWLEDALIFQIDPIVAWFETQQRSSIEIGAHELPNVAPLAATMWLEFHWPHRPDRIRGVLVHVDEDRADDACVRRLELGGWMHDAPRATRWRYICQPIDNAPAGVRVAQTLMQVWLDAEGRILSSQHDYIDAAHRGEAPPEGDALRAVATVVYCALLALCFAHCKGVSVAEHQQPRQQRRAAERAGRPPLVTYKTIDIAPVTRILRDEGHVEKNGIKRALHITRGHFAHYTEDAPLFGKYTGTFYRPMHVRGTLQAGAVVKDYRVHPAQAQP